MGTTRGSNARSDTRSTASASQLGDQRGKKKAGGANATNAREKRIDEANTRRRGSETRRGGAGGGVREGEEKSFSVDVRPGEKKRWNSVVYPVIYNWKLGATTRPKAIRRFHSGESPFFVLPKVVRPSTRIDAPVRRFALFFFFIFFRPSSSALLYRFFLFFFFLSSFLLPSCILRFLANEAASVFCLNVGAYVRILSVENL